MIINKHTDQRKKRRTKTCSAYTSAGHWVRAGLKASRVCCWTNPLLKRSVLQHIHVYHSFWWLILDKSSYNVLHDFWFFRQTNSWHSNILTHNLASSQIILTLIVVFHSARSCFHLHTAIFFFYIFLQQITSFPCLDYSHHSQNESFDKPRTAVYAVQQIQF